MAADYTLSPILKVLVKNHKDGINARDTVAELRENNLYRYTEVCEAAVNYWFRFITEHPNRFSTESQEISTSLKDRLAFLTVLIESNPFWTTNHFIEALKVSKTSIKKYLRRLGFYRTQHRWTRRESSSK